ncbi:Hypothetical protein, putative [Bodo saltans]|uniref:Uncharacterized protein n=1 Tax=Bodo saltans TaxID=75058 RepID=A0A0S4J0H3_BODSA|nr:Hypothetical protein, putative [Bodo saltans]|eukprot:CUG19522.1 Hypothetical protein, putative [Bodo saltans]
MIGVTSTLSRIDVEKKNVAALVMLWAARVSGPSPDWMSVPRLETEEKDAAPRSRGILPKAFTHHVHRAMRR